MHALLCATLFAAGLTAGADALAADLAIRMEQAAFVPARVSVAAGTRVTWTNDDTMPHSVTADDKRFDSGAVAPGQSFSWIADAPGPLAYHCIFHPSMTAVLDIGPPRHDARRRAWIPTSDEAKTMNAILMMQTATVLLAIAAIGGAVMAVIRFSGQPHPPTWLAMVHGLIAAAALTLLLYAYFTTGLPALAAGALALFVIAAIGGAVLNLNFHWQRLPLPKWLVLVHAAVAVVGFLLLLGAVISGPA